MINKDLDFIDIIFKAEGGKYYDINLSRVKEGFDFIHEKHFIDSLSDSNHELYCELAGHIEANNSDYANQGYKIGFKDGVRFLVSILCE